MCFKLFTLSIFLKSFFSRRKYVSEWFRERSWSVIGCSLSLRQERKFHQYSTQSASSKAIKRTSRVLPVMGFGVRPRDCRTERIWQSLKMWVEKDGTSWTVLSISRKSGLDLTTVVLNIEFTLNTRDVAFYVGIASE